MGEGGGGGNEFCSKQFHSNSNQSSLYYVQSIDKLNIALYIILASELEVAKLWSLAATYKPNVWARNNPIIAAYHHYYRPHRLSAFGGTQGRGRRGGADVLGSCLTSCHCYHMPDICVYQPSGLLVSVPKIDFDAHSCNSVTFLLAPQ